MDVLDQVCTLEQAKKILALGIKNTATFYWVDRGEKSRIVYSGQIGFLEALPIIAAYTVAELGEILPARVVTFKASEKYDLSKGKYYSSSQMQSECPRFYGETEAQARAGILIYFLENKLS